MFSSGSHLTEEQSRLLNESLYHFNALQESTSARLEGYSNTLNQLETNLNEKLTQEMGCVLLI